MKESLEVIIDLSFLVGIGRRAASDAFIALEVLRRQILDQALGQGGGRFHLRYFTGELESRHVGR